MITIMVRLVVVVMVELSGHGGDIDYDDNDEDDDDYDVKENQSWQNKRNYSQYIAMKWKLPNKPLSWYFLLQ